MPIITSLYAGLLGLGYIALFMGVGQARGQTNISLGVGDDTNLLVADRRHMNFIENVPLALLLIGLVELDGAPRLLVHALGAVLLIARVAHPFGLSVVKARSIPREIGAGGTLLVILAASLIALWQFATR